MAQFLRDREGQFRIEDIAFGEEAEPESGVTTFLESVARYRLSSHSDLARQERIFSTRLERFQLKDAYLNLDISPELAEIVAYRRHTVASSYIGSESLQEEVLRAFQPARKLAYSVICQLFPEEQRQYVQIEEHTMRMGRVMSKLVEQLPLPDDIPIIREQEQKLRLKIYVHAVADALSHPKERVKAVKSLQMVRKGIGALEFQWIVSLIFATDLGALDAIARAGVPVLTLLKSFLASLVLLRDLRLKERAHFQPPEMFNLNCFMFLRVAQLAWKTSGFLLDAFGRPLDLPVVDMFDGRLFHSVSATILAASDPDAAVSDLLGSRTCEYDTLLKAVAQNCSFRFPEASEDNQVASQQEPRILGHDGLWTKVLLHRPLQQQQIQQQQQLSPIKDPLGVIPDNSLKVLKSKWTNLKYEPHLASSLNAMEASADAPAPSPRSQSRNRTWDGRSNEASVAQLKQLNDYVEQMRAAAGPSKPFALEPFQEEAIKYMYNGHSVLVCAPTGGGKTYALRTCSPPKLLPD